MDTFARHLLVELHDCDRGLLNDIEQVRSLMRQAVEVAGAHVVAEVFHPYSPHGVTGVLVIEESHLSVHTWPEAGYAAVDFYTCGAVQPALAAAVLKQGLRARSVHMLEVQRGLPEALGGLRVNSTPNVAPRGE